MLVSFTSLSHWHDSPVILNPTLGPITISDNPLGYTATEAANYNSNPENTDLVSWNNLWFHESWTFDNYVHCFS